MGEDYTWDDEQLRQFGRSTARLADVALDAERQRQRVQELERENAAAMKLLDSCQKFLADLDTDDCPAWLDYAIHHFKRQVAGEISWDESSDQTLRRELTAAILSKDGDL